MNRPLIVGVMGGGTASDKDCGAAFDLGREIAARGWVLLSGGRNAGIMAASLKGAFEAGGTTVGILPDDHIKKASKHLTIPIITGMGQARNIINALSSQVLVALKGGAGTISEICFAIKYEKPVILLDFDLDLPVFAAHRHLVLKARTVKEAVAHISDILCP